MSIANSSTSSPGEVVAGYRGLIEKLFENHGFIFGSDNRRYVFHYTHCTTERQALKIGDSVEFDLVTDRRSRGGLRVSSVKKVYREPVLQIPQQQSSCSNAQSKTAVSSAAAVAQLPTTPQAGFVFLVPRDANPGSVACQVPGGNFFPSFSLDDLKDKTEAPLVVYGRKVECRLVLDDQGKLKAVDVVPECSSCKGVVTSVSDYSCLIDRHDVNEKILYRFSNNCRPKLGDCVEFVILPKKAPSELQDCCRLTVLPPGSVKIFDVSPEFERGVLSRLPQTLPVSSVLVPMNDQIRYKGCESQSVLEARGLLAQLGLITNDNGMVSSSCGTIYWNKQHIVFSSEELKIKHSLNLGDCIRFRLRYDHRTRSSEAIDLHFDAEQSFANSSEKRRQGFISKLDSNCTGVILDPLHPKKPIKFDIDELVNTSELHPVVLDAEVAFTVHKVILPGNVKCLIAKRVELLPKGSVCLDWQKARHNGVVIKLPSTGSGGDKHSALGVIKMLDSSCSIAAMGDKMIGFKLKDVCAVNGTSIQFGDEVVFCLLPQVNGYRRAVEVRLSAKPDCADACVKPEKFSVHKTLGERNGFVTIIKDKYGFIELDDHTQSCFFHYSTCKFETSLLKFKLHVVFELVEDAEGNLRAQNVQLTDASRFENIQTEFIAESVIGTVENELKLSQHWHSKASDDATVVQVVEGKIAVATDMPENLEALFTLSSLEDIRFLPKQGAQVQCSIVRETIAGKTQPLRAENVLPLSELCEASVESIKGEFGFLDHRINSTSKGLFFHSAELQNATMSELKVGDTVQFLVWENKKKSKWQAIHVKKIRCGNGATRKKTASYSKSTDCAVATDVPAAPYVDTRPEHLKKWQSSRSATANAGTTPQQDGGNTATTGETNGVAKSGGVNNSVVGDVVVIREPTFAPNLETKGFAVPRQLRSPGVFVAM